MGYHGANGVGRSIGSYSSYSHTASKGGVIALTQHLATLYGAQGVRANCLCPGATAGEGMGAFFRLPAAQAGVSGLIPMARVGQAEEVGAVAAYLLSDDASYVNGQILAADGGATAR